MPLFPRILPFILLAIGLCRAQGGSAIITLVMPPPGGDGYAAVQSGAAFAEGAATLYYNPALLAELERTTGSQLFFTRSSQDLLPVLRLPDLSQTFTAGTAVLADTAGWDMGIGFFHNAVNFGTTQLPDGRLVESGEDVYALGLGMRMGWPVSLGLTAKYIQSRLASGFAEDVNSWAFDFGIAARPRVSLFSPWASLPYLEIAPSLSYAVRNVGPDVFYSEASQADPIPRTFAFGAGLRGSLADLLEGEAAWDSEKESTWRSSSGSPVYTWGYSFYWLGVRYSQSWLDDRSGKRDERQSSLAVELNLLRLHRVWKRMQTGDFHSPSEFMDAGFPFARIRLLGGTFRANPRFVFGKRKIDSFDNGIREGQRAVYVSLSL